MSYRESGVRVKRLLKKIIASAIVLACAPFTIAISPAQANMSKFDFVACVNNEKAGSVLVLMDESGSIYNSDPKNMRVTGAQLLADDLQRVADKSQGEIKVQLAGSGDGFKPRTNGWVSIKPEQTSGSEELKKTAGEAWSKKPADKNYRETDLLSSLSGAQQALQKADGCKLLVVFKDGTDWQSFNKVSPVVDGYPEIQAMLDAGKTNEATEASANEICRDMGVADGFRNDNVYSLAVALGSGSFGNLDNFITGDCGSLPSRGSVLTVTSASELPNMFSRALDPSFRPEAKIGPFSFTMSNALQSFSILSSNGSAFENFTVVPPKGCTFIDNLSFDRALVPKTGVVGPDVTWTSYKYGQGETLRVIIKHKSRNADKCWNGVWSVQPNASGAQSSLEIDPNMQATAQFENKDIFLIPGTEPTQFKVELQQVDNSESLPVASLDPSVGVKVEGFLVDSNGEVVRNIMPGGEISRGQIEQPLSLEVDEDVKFGHYKLQLIMSLNVPGINSSFLKQVTWERDIEVRGELPAPTFVGSNIDFGDIGGTDAKAANVTIKNNSDKELVIDLKKSRVKLAQGPEGLTYQLVDNGNEISIPANGKVDTQLAIKLAGVDAVHVAGAVAGDIELVAHVKGADKGKKVEFHQGFHGVQKATSNAGVATWVSIIVLLLMTGVTLYAIYLVNSLSSRFPKRDALLAMTLAAASFNAKLTDHGLELSESVAESTKWEIVSSGSTTKEVMAAGYTFTAKSPGIKLAGESYGMLSGFDGFGSATNLHQANFTEPRVSLGLQHSYVVFVSENAMRMWACDSEDVDCSILFITSEIDSYAIQNEIGKINNSIIAARSEIADKLRAGASVLLDDAGTQLKTKKKFAIPTRPGKKETVTEAVDANAAYEAPKSVSDDPFD